MRAIETGDLIARRDNRNRWQIDMDDLEAWAAPNVRPVRTPMTNAHHVTALEAEIAGLKMLVDELRGDRNAWRDQAERLVRPWWRRIAS